MKSLEQKRDYRAEFAHGTSPSPFESHFALRIAVTLVKPEKVMNGEEKSVS